MLKESGQASSQYIVSPASLEKDLKYIRKKGYNAGLHEKRSSTTSTALDLCRKKPIVLSFDDGYYNNYYYAFPLLKKI